MKSFMKSFLKGLKIACTVILSIGCLILFFIILFGIFFKNQESAIQKEIAMTEISKKTEFDSTEEFSETNDETAEETAEPEQPAEASAEKTTAALSFAGDVQFSTDYTDAYDRSGIGALADETMLSHMRNADLFLLNHEFAFSLRGEPMEDKQFTFCTDPKYVKILQELGTDVVSLANNHSMDYGEDAFLDTLDTLDQAQIAHVGAGKNLSEALSPAVYTIAGQSFAIFAGTRVIPTTDWYAKEDRPGMVATYDPTGLNQAIAAAEELYDHTIVFVHWGIERNEFPEDYQRVLARGYIDAGADLVIGCHPHILQGFEYYQNVPIVYSLGNYLFGNSEGQTLLLNTQFDADGSLTVKLIPCKRENGVLRETTQTTALFSYLETLSTEVSISEDGILSSKTF